MKFTIEGFSQAKLVEYNLDVVDATILRYFIDFKDSGNMVSKIIKGKLYYWVKYEAIIEELPILKLNKPDSVYRRLQKMVKVNILESETVKQGGVYSYYKTGVNYITLISSRSDINPNTPDINPNKSDENPNQTDKYPEQKTHLLYPSTILNTTTGTEKPPSREYIDFFNNNFHLISSYELEILNSFINDGIEPDVVLLALKYAVEANRRDIRYVKTVLQRWLENNIKTVDAVIADRAAFERKKQEKTQPKYTGKPKKDNFNNFSQRTDTDFDSIEKQFAAKDEIASVNFQDALKDLRG